MFTLIFTSTLISAQSNLALVDVLGKNSRTERDALQLSPKFLLGRSRNDLANLCRARGVTWAQADVAGQESDSALGLALSTADRNAAELGNSSRDSFFDSCWVMSALFLCSHLRDYSPASGLPRSLART